MNATANSGSIPDEQPAMIEMVPVGATVVRLQLRSRRIGRTRSPLGPRAPDAAAADRKSTRLNSSHGYISYAVFCLKKKKKDLEAQKAIALHVVQSMRREKITDCNQNPAGRQVGKRLFVT